MHILINISNNLGGGGLQVALSFLQECKKINGHTFSVAVLEKNSGLIDINSFPTNFSFYTVAWKSVWQISPKMKKIERTVKPDVVFSVFGPTYWTPKVPHVMGFAIPHYIYQDSPFFEICSFKDNLLFFIKKHIHLFLFRHEADFVITETLDASERIEKKLKCKRLKYATVSNTCSSYFSNYQTGQNDTHILSERKENEFRFLYLTRYYTHKNIELIPKIVERLLSVKIKNVRFILTLDSEQYDTIVKKEFKPYILNVGFTPANKVPALYSEVDAIIQPSFLEVFSANYVEAMIMQKPILASDYSFAHSVCKNAALYFNPESLSEAVEGVLKIANDKKLRDRLISNGNEILKGFPTAKERAEMYLKIAEEMIMKKNRTSRKDIQTVCRMKSIMRGGVDCDEASVLPLVA